ncbi:MAG TPA: alpha/beta hydrolase [Dehalococcoidia bacterium]
MPRRPNTMRRLLAGLMALAVIPLAIACGETKGAEPSPAAIATAESASRVVSITGPSGKTPEAGGADDDVMLSGRVFGSGPTGVILVHTRLADQTAWFPFATQLAATGNYTVLTFDFRGFGDSSGDKDFDVVDVDLMSAYDYMRGVLNKRTVFLVGASTGGTAALVVGTRVAVAGVVSISSPGELPPLDAEAAVRRLDVAKLFIVSKDDVPQAHDQATMVAEAPEPKDAAVYDGNAHGTDLLQGPHAAEVEQRVMDFLSQYATASSGR